MIYIGAIFDGPELEGGHFSRVMTAFVYANSIARDESKEGDAPSYNIVFCVPGSLGEPDWTDLRQVRYSKKKKMILLHAAVPRDVVASDNAFDYIIATLREANDAAYRFYKHKGMHFAKEKADGLVVEAARLAKARLAEQK
jgi:hypothetical protein